MKSLVKKCVGYLGYEVKRVQRGTNRASLTLSAVDHNSREQREHFYSDAGQVMNYLNEDRRQFYREVTELLRRAVPDLQSVVLRIADYGCGPGLLLRQLSDASPRSEFYGYDFASSGIAVARGNFPTAQFGERDIYEVYPDRYDLILCTEVLEHLEWPKRALNNLLGQLSASGHMLLTVPDGRMDQYSGHIHFWSPESWTLFLEEACPGFEIETGRITTGRGKTFLFASIARPQNEVPMPTTSSRAAGLTASGAT